MVMHSAEIFFNKFWSFNLDFPAEIIKNVIDECPLLERLDLSDNSLNDSGLLSTLDAIKSKILYHPR